MQLESGEYWLTEAEKKKQKDKEKAQKKWEAKMQKKAEREKAFVAPKEEPKKKEAQKEETTMELAAKVKQQHVRSIPQFPFPARGVCRVSCVVSCCASFG
jgi:ribosomal RNA assembly protein